MDRRSEQAAFLRERTLRSPGARPTSRGAEMIGEWQRSAFLSDDVFALRMEKTGESADTFSLLLDDAPFLADEKALDWSAELAEATTHGTASNAHEATSTLYGTDHGRLLFNGLLRSLLSHYEADLLRRVGADPRIGRPDRLTPAAVGSLVQNLAGELTRICHRVLILELNVASSRGLLEGRTPQERYDFFDEQLLPSRAFLDTLFAEYPVLGRALVGAARNWRDSGIELLARFAQDAPLLHGAGLVGEADPDIAEIRTGLGDLHLNGRSVARITCGDGSVIYYKPRSVEPERVYADTVGLLNDRCPGLGLRAMRVLTRPGYGWCEPVEHQACADREAVSRFYRRMGASLAGLLFLGAVDIHSENLIAAGEHPVPVDLETILQHTSVSHQSSDTATERAFDLLSQSVMASLMLPIRALGDGFEESVDISAIGGGTARTVKRKAPSLVDPFTDVMRIGPAPLRTEGAANRPRLNGDPVTPGDHTDEVVQGFTGAYDAITADKEVFRAVLTEAANVPVRFIPRPTRRYSLFLRESRHPDHMRSGTDTDRLLEKLWTAVGTRRDLAPVVEHERRQIEAGDIPVFHSSPASTALYSGPEKVADGFFSEPGAVALERKLDLFGPEHRATQLGMVEDALAALPRSPSAALRSPRPGASVPVDPGDLRGTAAGVIDMLADSALLGSDDCTWVGINLDGIRDESIEFRPMTTSLYDGLAGMGVLFGRAASVLGHDRYADLARRSMVPVLAEMEEAAHNSITKGVGAYNGLAGSFYALDHMADALGEEEYTGRIHDHLPLLRKCAEAEEGADVVSGLAGCGIVAAALYSRHGFGELLDIVAVCAERLAASGVETGEGTGWRAEPDAPLLGGLSHGAAGIGWALLHMADALGDDGVRALGLRALTYDQGLAVPGLDAWQDLRTWRDRTGLNDTHPALWCHGATGIGITRLLAHERLPDAGFDEQARSALRAVRDRGRLGNQCLCHGDFGNMELFTLAAGLLPDSDWPAHRDAMADRLLASLGSEGFDFGRIIGKNVFGLMMGKAGVALSLLRLLEPGRVPSVLWLDSPTNGIGK